MNEVERLARDPRVTVRRIGPPDPDGRCVVYWMQRAQRGIDNPALDVAIALGNALGKPVVVFLAPVPFFPRANRRHYRFLLDGIPDVARALERRRVGFVLRPYPEHSLVRFCEQVAPALVVGDENPLRETERWRERAAALLRTPLWTVDADVIVPSRIIGREHYGARTIRPRLKERLGEFLAPSPEPSARMPWRAPRGVRSQGWSPELFDAWTLDESAGPVGGWRGGTREGLRRLRRFVRERLERYAEDRRHPERTGTSGLSPYLHFGHLGPRQVALAIQGADADPLNRDAFLEELIVRRELAVNFVRYNPAYDRVEGAEPWALRTLRRHLRDRRPHLYTERQLEQAETHDPLWNAAQRQMVTTGWMHGYIRMYWAKKLLEWSPTPAAALEMAIRQNDRWELDGRDPNGYANIAWAILGKHDRPWGPERPIFGTVRFMSYASTSRKFDSARYIAGAD